MKSGAGDDPFADDTDDEPQSDADGEEQASDVDRRPTTDRDGEHSRNDGSARREQEPTTGDDPDDSSDDEDAAAEIPWVLRRSRVKEDRDNVHQFFLRDEYSATEDEIMAAVADELEIREKDLKKLDVREAMVATADAEAIAATLSEWGYEYVD
ncbi:hypothetical protein [Halostella salina]|uniref:hypothetical protein n=1 Tax=Halostella salina TaxID=1547897 RepID=UPI000EF76C84|nr:hypothetical protein [Halostella salina]